MITLTCRGDCAAESWVVLGEVRKVDASGSATTARRAPDDAGRNRGTPCSGARDDGGVAISEASVRRLWHRQGLKLHRVESFTVSHNPDFAEKLEDIVGLYRNPPEHPWC